MAYIVTHGGIRGGPAGINPGLTLGQALEDARRLLAEGHSDIAIQDGKGGRVSGSDLVACCKGERKLMADLCVI